MSHTVCLTPSGAWVLREVEEEEVLEDLTCAQLKTRLRVINKPVSGRKAELIQRIREHEEQKKALFKEDEETDDEDEDTDDKDEDSDDEEDPDRCVKCDRRFNQRKLLNDTDCAIAWEIYCEIKEHITITCCDIGDDEGDLCGACLEKWVEGQLLFFRFVESEMKKELKDE